MTTKSCVLVTFFALLNIFYLTSVNDIMIKKKVIEEVSKLNCGVLPTDIDRAHRSSYKRDAVVVRCNSWFARNQIYEARKKSNWFWEADLTERRRSILQHARERIGNPADPAHSLIKAVFADRNCKLGCITKNDKFVAFSAKAEFDMCVGYEENSSEPYVSIWANRGIEKERYTVNGKL